MGKKVKKEKGNLHLDGITSGDILTMLAKKHSDDVFIPECKNGETWGARDLLLIDAWVLRRTYSPLKIIGYEIKCSRRDFEQDQKWTGYLDLCHEFYFVCPAGLIRATDLPNRIGIIWVTNNRLHTKRKAERVEPDAEKLLRLLIYVVMSRSRIVDNMYETGKPEPKSNLELKREELERAQAQGDLAGFVRGHVREVYETCRQKELDISYRERTVKRFEDHLAQLGIKWDSEKHDWQDIAEVENQIGLLKKHIDWGTLRDMELLSTKLTQVVAAIKDLTK